MAVDAVAAIGAAVGTAGREAGAAEGAAKLYGVPTLIHAPCELEYSHCDPSDGLMKTESMGKPIGTGVPATCAAVDAVEGVGETGTVADCSFRL